MLKYSIQANVVDIRSQLQINEVFSSEEEFLVDSNVWIWWAYPSCEQVKRGPRRYQSEFYPKYIEKLIHNQVALRRCELSLSELASFIERAELELFRKSFRQSIPISNPESKELQEFERTIDQLNRQFNDKVSPNRILKIFRHNCSIRRQDVVAAITFAWDQIKAISVSLDTKLSDAMTQSALENLPFRFVDCYDLFMIEDILNKGIFRVITDDADFATVKGIEVYTANGRVISEAEKQGKLIR